ncbi:hypothetical protein ALMP_17080 [Streptomyces sp. A012304]|nr:hypothetical protein ALMP_17080 [Streptomyces sp. A012304]
MWPPETSARPREQQTGAGARTFPDMRTARQHVPLQLTGQRLLGRPSRDTSDGTPPPVRPKDVGPIDLKPPQAQPEPPTIRRGHLMTDAPEDHRVISRDLPDGGRIIAVVKTGRTPDEPSDDEILDSMIERSRNRRHLHAVDDE